MEPVLEVKNLTKIFKRGGQEDLAAVKNVSFCLYPGEILGIVGESGSGKSTAARMITRLIKADSGRILLRQEDITEVRGKRLRQIYQRIQMVFQSPAASFDPRRTLGDGIGEGLRNSGISRPEARRQVRELLLRCGLKEEFAGRYPHEVSGGQCQRAAIARALASKPAILLADEPTGNLDSKTSQEVLGLLKLTNSRFSQTIVMITHSEELAQLCDRIIRIEDGRILEDRG